MAPSHAVVAQADQSAGGGATGAAGHVSAPGGEPTDTSGQSAGEVTVVVALRRADRRHAGRLPDGRGRRRLRRRHPPRRPRPPRRRPPRRPPPPDRAGVEVTTAAVTAPPGRPCRAPPATVERGGRAAPPAQAPGPRHPTGRLPGPAAGPHPVGHRLRDPADLREPVPRLGHPRLRLRAGQLPAGPGWDGPRPGGAGHHRLPAEPGAPPGGGGDGRPARRRPARLAPDRPRCSGTRRSGRSSTDRRPTTTSTRATLAGWTPSPWSPRCGAEAPPWGPSWSPPT